MQPITNRIYSIYPWSIRVFSLSLSLSSFRGSHSTSILRQVRLLSRKTKGSKHLFIKCFSLLNRSLNIQRQIGTTSSFADGGEGLEWFYEMLTNPRRNPLSIACHSCGHQLQLYQQVYIPDYVEYSVIFIDQQEGRKEGKGVWFHGIYCRLEFSIFRVSQRVWNLIQQTRKYWNTWKQREKMMGWWWWGHTLLLMNLYKPYKERMEFATHIRRSCLVRTHILHTITHIQNRNHHVQIK